MSSGDAVTATLETTRETFAKKVHVLGGTVAAARALKISRGFVEMLRNGSRLPGLKVAARIEDVMEIPLRAWIVDEKWTSARRAVH